MSCHGNNATPPSPGIAPGREHLNIRDAAADIAARWNYNQPNGGNGGGVDPRIAQLVPGFDAPFFQAGLAGYSDAAMRIVARALGCPMCVTESLLDRLLLGGGHGFDKANLSLIRDNTPFAPQHTDSDDASIFNTSDAPLTGQIIGSDPDEMAAGALKMIEQAARPAALYRALASASPNEPEAQARDPSSLLPSKTFNAIDVNLACPVKKIKNKGRGGHWLNHPTGAIDILRAVRDAVPPNIPTTVKMRRSFDDTPEAAANFHTIFNAAYELGYSWVTVHGRTVKQKYLGPSKWTALRDLTAQYPDRLIFGSGDVWTAHDVIAMLAYTGVHAVSIARGCIGNPWIFRQVRQLLAGQPMTTPTIDEQRNVLEHHYALCLAVNGPYASRLMRKFGIKFAAHHPHPDAVKQRMISISNPDDWHAVLRDHYNAQQPLSI